MKNNKAIILKQVNVNLISSVFINMDKKKIPDQNVHYVYPTQIYEMVAYFLIFLYLYRYRHKVNFNGELFFEYLFLTGLSRFLIDFIRFHDSNAF